MQSSFMRTIRPGMFSKESLAKTYFKGSHSLIGIAEDERYDIQRAMLDNWGSESGFIEEMEGKFGRSDAQWSKLFINERTIAGEAADIVIASRDGKETKSWTLGDSNSGPCDECVQLSEENQDVPIGENFSNGSKIPHAHPGCCCQSDFSYGSASE